MASVGKETEVTSAEAKKGGLTTPARDSTEDTTPEEDNTLTRNPVQYNTTAKVMLEG